MKYQDFEVKIQADPAGGFRAELVNSPVGETFSAFKIPFPRRRLDKLPLLYERLRKAQQNGSKGHPSAEEIGQELYTSLFSGDVGRRFHESLANVEALGRDKGLRIRLSFDLNNSDLVFLAALPWELLWDRSKNDFLCLIPKTPLVRYIPMHRSPLPDLEGQLKVLVVQSSPKDLEPLDLKAEWRALWKKLEPRPDIFVDTLLHPSLEGVQKKLLDEPWHVLHFMGHGGFDQESGQGRLNFEGPSGDAERVTGTLLARHLRSFPDLRLVLLSACKSGVMPRRKGLDPFSSTALALVQAGVPAVVATQAPIADAAAIAFSAAFYDRIAARDPVDAAMVQGRLAILRTLPFDWGTPILFTRVPDSDILGTAAKVSHQEAPASCRSRQPVPLRLGIRTFSETPGRALWGQEMEEECDDILDFRSFFTGPGGRYPKDPAIWQAEIVPGLQKFLQSAISLHRPIHLNFANHASIAFAAGYFLESKSGLEITLRQRGHAGVAEWRALAGAAHKGTLFLREKEIPGAGDSRDVAVALSITLPVLSHVQHYLETAQLAVHRTVPVTLAPAPSPLGVRDGLHAFRLAEGIALRLRERPSQESGGTAHLFAAAPNAMLFFLGQLCQGLGKIQLYEHDFFSGRPGDYSPSILLG